MSRLLLTTMLSAALFVVTSFVASRDAQADECSDKQAEAESGGVNYTTKIVNGRKTIVIQKLFVVCGKVPRPNVIYVLQATAINYEWENLKQDFLPKIRKSVTKAPF